MRAPPICLRELTAEEAAAVEGLARSRTAAARRVERARIVWRASQRETPPSIAEALGLSAETVRRRIRRFNAEGLAALEDHHRSGRPTPYAADAVATVIATALTSPRRLGLPFAAWTLDRLAAYLGEHKGRAVWVCLSRRGHSIGSPPIWGSTRGAPSGFAFRGVDTRSARRLSGGAQGARRLGLPFAAWTLDRLAAYLGEHKGRAVWVCLSRRGHSIGSPPILGSTKGSPSGAAGLTRSCSRRACAGAGTRPGSASGSTPRSRKKGAHRDALHHATGGQPSRPPGRDGASQRQELPGTGPGPTATAPRRPGSAGDRLRPAWQGLCLRGLLPRDGSRLHPTLPGAWDSQLGGLPGGRRGLAAARCRAGLRHRRQPEQPPRYRRTVVHAGPSALGGGVP